MFAAGRIGKTLAPQIANVLAARSGQRAVVSLNERAHLLDDVRRPA
jgi:hypothetical protein